MKNSRIIKKNYEFEKIITKKNFLKNQSFVIYSIKNNENILKYGISVSKKNWKAWERNKIKRQVRSIIWEYIKTSENHSVDIIVMVRKEFEKKSFNENTNEFIKLVNKLRK
ncbi:ribonuclease P (protein C5) [Spiroplasma sp. TIUS-1]|uniref:ribonuclease P protein component n=1 Tax=Spiroplasma sp. TIUS-1 TaxID=216963 RepID=UPI001397E742|nr:ribonuclease P protein component [Spiroplasma sp. TIUS-1]QHX36252.1 ribonuclease P (protein C5) [Spiroplasma sp. TIUS-1]